MESQNKSVLQVERFRPDDAALRERILGPYRDNVKYLSSAEVRVSAERAVLRGSFAIPAPCYVDLPAPGPTSDVAHFTAVEFNLCFNQAAYYLVAKCVQDGLVSAFGSLTVEGFFERQLGNMVIYQLNSRFRRTISPRSFEGEVSFGQPLVRDRVVVLHMAVRFWDDAGGASDGKVTTVLTAVP